MTIFVAIVAACWAIFIAVWVVSSFKIKHTAKRRRPGTGELASRLVVVFFVMIMVGAKIKLNWDFLSGGTLAVLNIIGIVLVIGGVGLAIWARVHLGRNWGTPMSVKAEPELVTSGPYAYIRHPIYSGMFLAILGSALATSPVWLVPFFASSVYFIFAGKREEATLEEFFPNAYPPYKARTKMFLPFLF